MKTSRAIAVLADNGGGGTGGMEGKIRIAVAQTISGNGKIGENLARATTAAERAVRDGAEPVLSPSSCRRDLS
jgi:hypothetical protein